MKILFWLILIILVFRYIMRVFGKALLQLFMQGVAKQVAKDFKNQQQTYDRYQKTGPFNENVYQKEEIRVTAPKNKKTKSEDIFAIAEEVDYEEI